MHINLTLRVLKQQIPELNGLGFDRRQCNKIQTIHCEKCHHWNVASTANTTSGTTDVVMVMDSFYYTTDQDTKQIIDKSVLV